jgi:hypothetical protein
MQTYRTFLPHDKRGAILATQRDKAPPWPHHGSVFHADLTLMSEPIINPSEGVPLSSPRAKQTKGTASNVLELQPFPLLAPIPA